MLKDGGEYSWKNKTIGEKRILSIYIFSHIWFITWIKLCGSRIAHRVANATWKPQAYLESRWTSTIELFCENI